MQKELKAEALSDMLPWQWPTPAALTWLRDLTPLLVLSLSFSLSQFANTPDLFVSDSKESSQDYSEVIENEYKWDLQEPWASESE